MRKFTLRMRVLLIVVAVLFTMAAGRAVQIQAVDADATAAQAAKQLTRDVDIPPLRGTITDRSGETLAYSEPTVLVYADPTMIRTNGRGAEKMTDNDVKVAAEAPAKLAKLLVQFLGGKAEDYLPKLTKEGSYYQVLAREVSAENATLLLKAMRAAELVGLSTEDAPTRRYPGGTLASNVLGYVRYEGNGTSTGASGLELALDADLVGTPGKEVYEQSPKGRLPSDDNQLVPAVNGADYQLTLDAGLQLSVEQILADRVNASRANYGTATVMDMNTGEILALANYPTFDANDPSASKKSTLGNRAVSDPFTPGSVQKVLTFAALLDAGLVSPTEVVTIPPQINSGGYMISDDWVHGTVDVLARGVLAKSSNVGMIKLSRRMGKEALLDYYLSFGLGAKTGVGLPGESAGILPKRPISDQTRDGLAFGGSALSVTALQEAAAVAAVTNGGVYHQPYIVASKTLPDGTVEDLAPQNSRRVISQKASAQVASMMEAMMVNSTGEVFDVE
ncbi:MAG: penicillin-binding protein 2, partial [Propionibacteriaceae bacterium]|nr:penicillin-binding protein 2 [Propionibacteriaceae bacterium]